LIENDVSLTRALLSLSHRPFGTPTVCDFVGFARSTLQGVLSIIGPPSRITL